MLVVPVAVVVLSIAAHDDDDVVVGVVGVAGVVRWLGVVGVAGVVEVVIAVVVVVVVADDGDDGGGMGGAAHGGGFGGAGDGFPNRRRAERLLCIKSACDRLLHSEELFTRVTDSTLAWQGRRSTASGSDCECGLDACTESG